MRGVRRDLEEVRRLVVAVGADEVEGHLAGDRAGVRGVLLGVARPGRRLRVGVDLELPVDEPGALESPALVGRTEQHPPVVPARRDRRGDAVADLVLVEELADEAGRVAALLQPHREAPGLVAVGRERLPAADRADRVRGVGGVGQHAGLVGVLAGEQAGARDAAQRVDDERVGVVGTPRAHRRGGAHRVDEVEGEVVHQHHHDARRPLEDRPRADGQRASGPPAPRSRGRRRRRRGARRPTSRGRRARRRRRRPAPAPPRPPGPGRQPECARFPPVTPVLALLTGMGAGSVAANARGRAEMTRSGQARVRLRHRAVTGASRVVDRQDRNTPSRRRSRRTSSCLSGSANVLVRSKGASR